MQGRFVENPAYVEYETLLKQLHCLIAEGKCESAEADEVRDTMDGPERHLNRPEKARLKGLSADLYMLSGEEITVTPVPPDITVDAFMEELREHERWNDWEGVLGLLRRRPSSMPEGRTAFVRSRAYWALGHADTALRFFDYSMRDYRTLALDQDTCRALRLLLLAESGRVHEAVALSSPTGAKTADLGPASQIAAGSVLRGLAHDAQTYLEALQKVERAFAQVSPRSPVPVTLAVFGYLIAADCLQNLGDAGAAQLALEEAARLAPDDLELARARDSMRSSATSAPSAFAQILAERQKRLFQVTGPMATSVNPIQRTAA